MFLTKLDYNNSTTSSIPQCTGASNFSAIRQSVDELLMISEFHWLFFKGGGQYRNTLQCDRCVKDDNWKCIECLGISGEVYDALLDCKELSWFCEECTEQVPKGKDEREDKVIGLLKKVLDRLSNLEERL